MDAKAVSRILIVAVFLIGVLVDLSTGQLVPRYDFFSNVNATFYFEYDGGYFAAGNTWNTNTQLWIPTFNFHTLGYINGDQIHENAFSNFKSGGKIFQNLLKPCWQVTLSMQQFRSVCFLTTIYSNPTDLEIVDPNYSTSCSRAVGDCDHSRVGQSTLMLKLITGF